jgi:hypothetical protein
MFEKALKNIDEVLWKVTADPYRFERILRTSIAARLRVLLINCEGYKTILNTA